MKMSLRALVRSHNVGLLLVLASLAACGGRDTIERHAAHPSAPGLLHDRVTGWVWGYAA